MNKRYKIEAFFLLFLLFPVVLLYAQQKAGSAAYERFQRKALLDAVQRKQGMSKVESLAAKGVPVQQTPQPAPEKKEAVVNPAEPSTETPPNEGYLVKSAGPVDKEVPLSPAPQPVSKEKATIVNKSEAAKKDEPQAEPLPAVEYYIAPGDTMDIVVLEEPYSTEEATDGSQKSAKVKDKKSPRKYTINVGDTLEVLIWQTPDLSKDVIVGPDGRVSYPLVGRIDAAGQTIEEVEKKLTEEMSRYVKTPHVSVMVKEFAAEKIKPVGDRIATVLDRIGASRAITVGPDGKISYPLIGRFQAAGKSITQLEAEIAAKLSPYVQDPKVSVLMTKFTGDKIVILGEVKSPGIYTFYGQINLLECLALAGDFTDKARKDSVIVIHGNFSKKPEVARINLHNIMMKGTAKTDIILRPDDVIYVPKSYIANFNKFLENIQPFLDTVTSIVYIKDSIVPAK